jgi:hypothetical protein
MADPFTWTMIAAGAGAAGSLAGGFMEAKGLDAQANAADYKARNLALQANQTKATRAVELNDTMATIDAIRGSRNVSLDSPTAMVIERARKQKSDDVTNAEVLGIRQGITEANYEAKNARSGKKWALASGVLGAAGSLAQGFAQGGG